GGFLVADREPHGLGLGFPVFSREPCAAGLVGMRESNMDDGALEKPEAIRHRAKPTRAAARTPHHRPFPFPPRLPSFFSLYPLLPLLFLFWSPTLAMDYFSHIDSSQQQQQQQQQNQRQQQQQKPYDLAQPHLHDAYYGYHQQRSYDAAAAASSHDQYYYHPPEHAASHHEQRPAGAQLDSSAAAGLPLDASQGIHRRGGGASVVPGGGDDPLGPYATPTGMNPAAAAAVAALSQLVETVDAAKRTGVGSLEQWQRDAVDPGMRSYVMPPPQHPHGYAVQAGGMHRG
ncbi:hypothetical protein Taro_041488, partial [Colocasia esculenta]|nr:hypothetical protein [Colocasia esculenta]